MDSTLMVTSSRDPGDDGRRSPATRADSAVDGGLLPAISFERRSGESFSGSRNNSISRSIADAARDSLPWWHEHIRCFRTAGSEWNVLCPGIMAEFRLRAAS
jgi:hypothetical protein